MAQFGLQKNASANGSSLALLATSLILIMSLSGCGKKGPLYLPEAIQPESKQPESKQSEAESKSSSAIANNLAPENTRQTTQQDTP